MLSLKEYTICYLYNFSSCCASGHEPLYAKYGFHKGHQVAQWIRDYAESRKVADSRPDEMN
jgi:hypothetical protein